MKKFSQIVQEVKSANIAGRLTKTIAWIKVQWSVCLSVCLFLSLSLSLFLYLSIFPSGEFLEISACNSSDSPPLTLSPHCCLFSSPLPAARSPLLTTFPSSLYLSGSCSLLLLSGLQTRTETKTLGVTTSRWHKLNTRLPAESQAVHSYCSWAGYTHTNTHTHTDKLVSTGLNWWSQRHDTPSPDLFLHLVTIKPFVQLVTREHNGSTHSQPRKSPGGSEPRQRSWGDIRCFHSDCLLIMTHDLTLMLYLSQI